MGWLADVFSPLVQAAGTFVNQRKIQNFKGAVSIADNPSNGSTDITIGIGSLTPNDVQIQTGTGAQELVGLYSGGTLIGSLFTWSGTSSGQTIWNASQNFIPIIQGFVTGVQYTANGTHAFTGGLTLTGDADVTGALILEPEVTPTAPGTSGANKLFSRSSDGHACIRNSAGVVTDLSGSVPAAGVLVVLVTLTAGSGTAASGHTLTSAKIIGVYLTTASAAVGSPAPSISGNNVVITSYGPGAASLITDASTYAVVLVGWT
jgi:hypothetical protein